MCCYTLSLSYFNTHVLLHPTRMYSLSLILTHLCCYTLHTCAVSLLFSSTCIHFLLLGHPIYMCCSVPLSYGPLVPVTPMNLQIFSSEMTQNFFLGTMTTHCNTLQHAATHTATHTFPLDVEILITTALTFEKIHCISRFSS